MFAKGAALQPHNASLGLLQLITQKNEADVQRIRAHAEERLYQEAEERTRMADEDFDAGGDGREDMPGTILRGQADANQSEGDVHALT
eukprot:GSA25T00022459001.1